MCLEKIEEQEGEIKALERELNRAQSALTLISEGLNVLHTMGTMARPSEFEILFKDYAPFNNIMAHYFPKGKKALETTTPNVEVTGAARLYRAASVWTAGLAP